MSNRKGKELKRAVQLVATLDGEILARAFGCKGSKQSQRRAEEMIRHLLKKRVASASHST